MGHYFEIDFPSPLRVEEIPSPQKGKRKREEALEMAHTAREETRDRPTPTEISGTEF